MTRYAMIAARISFAAGESNQINRRNPMNEWLTASNEMPLGFVWKSTNLTDEQRAEIGLDANLKNAAVLNLDQFILEHRNPDPEEYRKVRDAVRLISSHLLHIAMDCMLPDSDLPDNAQRLQDLRDLRESLAAQGVDFDAWAQEAQAMRKDNPVGT